jgi:hypothetical protein
MTLVERASKSAQSIVRAEVKRSFDRHR